MTNNLHGVIDHIKGNGKKDYLYRLAVKGMIFNQAGEVLLVKESGRDWWDLPGGGVDHGEDIKTALAREMKEEVNLIGEFTYHITHITDPVELVDRKILQIFLIFTIKPEIMEFSPGDDGDEVAFVPLDKIKESDEPKYEHLKKIILH